MPRSLTTCELPHQAGKRLMAICRSARTSSSHQLLSRTEMTSTNRVGSTTTSPVVCVSSSGFQSPKGVLCNQQQATPDYQHHYPHRPNYLILWLAFDTTCPLMLPFLLFIPLFLEPFLFHQGLYVVRIAELPTRHVTTQGRVVMAFRRMVVCDGRSTCQR